MIVCVHVTMWVLTGVDSCLLGVAFVYSHDILISSHVRFACLVKGLGLLFSQLPRGRGTLQQLRVPGDLVWRSSEQTCRAAWRKAEAPKAAPSPRGCGALLPMTTRS